jgi:hypothetical protein
MTCTNTTTGDAPGTKAVLRRGGTGSAGRRLPGGGGTKAPESGTKEQTDTEDEDSD